MSGLYPDESYCTSEIGHLVFQPKTDWTGTVSVIRIIETKAIAGTHNDYVLEFKLSPRDIVDSEPRIFHITSRYRELNKLHSALAKSHKQLYLRGIFPSFPSPRIIGSGDPSVLAERRHATEVFLNFVLEHEVLRKSCVLHEFLDKAKEDVATAASALVEEELYSTIDMSHNNVPPSAISEEQPHSISSEAQSSTNHESSEFVFPEIALGNQLGNVARKTSSKRLFPKLRIDLNVPQSEPNNYLVKAAILVSTAKKAEQEKEFELAFQCYKNAARGLAEGVRTETDSALRNAVKRKTAIYIVRAEELFKQHLSYDGSTLNLEGLLSGSLHLQDPNVFAFKSSNNALKDYSIVSVLPHLNSRVSVLLLEEKCSGSKFVMKLLEKGTVGHGRVLLPTDVPHMVQLHKFFETENYILLLVDYVQNGRLFDFLANILVKTQTRKRKGVKMAFGDIPHKKFDYSGKKLLFSVGFDIERVVAMRDDQQSTDDPSTYEVSCTMGEDCVAELSEQAGEFYMSKEQQSNLHEVCEELPATLTFSSSSSLQAERDKSRVSLAPALFEVKNFLLSRKQWPKENPLPEVLVVHWTAQIISFLYIMHMHHDEYIGFLNPSHILLDANGNIVLTYHAQWYSSEICSTIPSKYTAPESNKLDWKPNAKSDVYTLGCILFEMITGNPLWMAAPHGISRDDEIPVDGHPSISLACRDLLSRMLAPEAERCSLDEVRSHAYYSSIDWHLYDNPR